MTPRVHASSATATWTWLIGQLDGRPLPSVVAIIGLGEGRLLEALDRHAPGTRVLALEPDADAARAFSVRPECEAWRSRGRLAYLIGPDYAGADEAWRVFPNTGDEPAVLVDPDLSRNPNVTRDDVGRAAQVLKKILFGVKGNREARRKFAPRYLVNAIRNIPAMLAGSDVRNLADAYRGVPAVIVGAGPSLDDNITDLRELQDRALIISTDTALRPLLMSGISPQLVVGLDPSELNMRHFMALPECRDTWLVSEMALDRRATAVFEGRTFWFRASNHQPAPWLREQGVDIGQIDVWGSVLTGAFQIAVLAGCDPVVAVGADLAFTNGRPYARGTTYEFDWAWNAAAGMDCNTSWITQIASGQKAVSVSDVNGNPTRVTESLVSFRDWLVARASKSGRQVINATGAGILFGDRIEQLPLRQALNRPAIVPAIDTLTLPSRRCRQADVAARIRSVHEACSAGDRSRTPLPQWVEFSGGAFDESAVTAALQDALRALESGIATPASIESWPACITSSAGRRSLVRLADDVARFRDVLHGTAVGARMDDAERSAIAADAVRLLEWIALVPDAGLDGGVPASLALKSPETMRWAVQAFEGLLGAMANSGSRLQESAFFNSALRPRQSGFAPAVDAVPGPNRTPAVLAGQLSRWLSTEDVVSIIAPRGVTEAHLARRLTGARRTTAPAAAGATVERWTVRLLVRPKVLTDAGLPRLSVVYQTDRGAVCVRHRTKQTLVIGPDGSITSNAAWPRPITGELPLKGGGAVAWSNGSGTDSWRPAYVMYRQREDARVTTQQLRFRPAIGCWWQDRLYWNCYPTAPSPWSGVVSWAPGEQVLEEIDGLTLWSMQPEADGLALYPAEIRAGSGFKRMISARALRWSGTGEPEPIVLGSHGSVSARASCNGWSATAYPEADVILLESVDGRSVAMTCYYPRGLAWAGGSLVVSTAEREILLFEGLIDRLQRVA